MWSRVCETLGCLPIHVSVCPICLLQQHGTGLLLWAQFLGDIDRFLHGQHRIVLWLQHGEQQAMRVVPLF